MKMWIIDKWNDFKWWYVDNPYTKIWKGIKDRVDAFVFCSMLLIVGVCSPKTLRKLMVDSLRDTK